MNKLIKNEYSLENENIIEKFKNTFNKKFFMKIIIFIIFFYLISFKGLTLFNKDEIKIFKFTDIKNISNINKNNLFFNKSFFKDDKIKLIRNDNILNDTIFIDIDNQFNSFENNINYSNYSTDIKTIALYLPQFHFIKENDRWWGKNFTEWTKVKNAKPFYKGHHQPRKPGDEKGYLGYYYLTNSEIIKKQVKLAKSHGIYGFGIYYYWFSGKRLLEKPLDIYLENKDIDFPFLLIWANENWSRAWDGSNRMILIKQEYKKDDPENFIKDIKKYVIDQRYIKLKDKPIIGIYEPYKIPNITETILIWRRKSKEYGIGEIYIIIRLTENQTENFINTNLFDAAYDFPPRNNIAFIFKNKLYRLYTSLIYKYVNFINTTNKFPIFIGSMLEWDNTPRRGKYGGIFKEYSPEKFYLLNKIIIKWTKQNFNESNRFIFINAWNEWGEGSYLEPDDKYGYSSINALSKALFNLPYISNYNIVNLTKSCQIIVQAHIFYYYLIDEIVNKTNNIPAKFDLYITTTSLKNKIYIEGNIKKYSYANNYSIKIVENKGRDVFPFLKQLKFHFKNYKYVCHIHTKNTKTMFFPKLGQSWRNYIFNNLLGSKEIILEILSNFENYEKLGFIFPETYHEVYLAFGKKLNDIDRYYMNVILKMIFNNNKYQIGKILDFPEGNMFWAKISSIYQIFITDFDKLIPQEKGQKDGTLLHGIERIWLYLVKINGYYYQKIFKHY